MHPLLLFLSLLSHAPNPTAAAPLPSPVGSRSPINSVHINATAYAPPPAANFTPPTDSLHIIEKIMVNDGHGGKVKIAEVELDANFRKFVQAKPKQLKALAGEMEEVASLLNMTAGADFGEGGGGGGTKRWIALDKRY
ncbi:MAG: hypothetical protein M1828_004177 [Chrysothrix sp. TS-e1954]|nr:MAG: hypothetical protein M1828_004177 [Chrysothrix sp. TS-e1954]